MYIALSILGLITAFIGFMLFQYKRNYYGWVPLFLGSISLFITAYHIDGNVTHAPVDMESCVVQSTTNGGYSVRHVIAYGQMVPLVSMNRTTLSGMPIDWNEGGAVNSKVGDTVYVYMMRQVSSKFWLFKDTTDFLCVNESRIQEHEYDLFLQLLESGTKEEVSSPK